MKKSIALTRRTFRSVAVALALLVWATACGGADNASVDERPVRPDDTEVVDRADDDRTVDASGATVTTETDDAAVTDTATEAGALEGEGALIGEPVTSAEGAFDDGLAMEEDDGAAMGEAAMGEDDGPEMSEPAVETEGAIVEEFVPAAPAEGGETAARGDVADAPAPASSDADDLADVADAAGSPAFTSSESDASTVDEAPAVSAAAAMTESTESDAEAALAPALSEPVLPASTPAPVQPQAGLLTAGDIDDNLNLDYFAQLVGSWQQEAGRDVPYVELRDRVAIDVVATNGVGIGNVTLEVSDGQRSRSIVTNSAGRAFLYPTWLGLDLDDGATVTVSDDQWDIESQELAAGTVTIEAVGDTSPPTGLDVALVLDVTGSMADELNYLTVEFESIVTRLEADYGNVDMRFALVVYRDSGDDFVTRVFDFTDNVGLMRRQLADQFANGGGDFPEAMHSALNDAEDLSWRSGDRVASMLILNADAPPHANKVQQALDASRRLGEQGVRVYPLAASGVDRNAEFIMRAMAATTGGRHMFLTGDSGIGGSKLEPKAECYVVTGLDDLLYRVMASELAGERIEPFDQQIVRRVGQYTRGACA